MALGGQFVLSLDTQRGVGAGAVTVSSAKAGAGLGTAWS
jgi:hypothetical protein